MFKKNPLSLISVAFIFLLIGLYGLYDGLMTLYTERYLEINLLILGIPVFWGLLKHYKGWRTLALFFISVEMIFSALGFIPAVLIIFNRELIPFNLFGISSKTMSFPVAFFTLLAFFLIALWQYKVLTSKKIKQMFISEK